MASEWDGVPDYPDQNGWHWVCSKPMAWLADWQRWSAPASYMSPDEMSRRAKVLGAYEGALRTPTQHAADLAAARREEREACADEVEDWMGWEDRTHKEPGDSHDYGWNIALKKAAAAIRARGGSDA